MNITIREATESDLIEVIKLIRELAIFEIAEEEVTITKEELLKDGFGEHPLYWILLAELENEVVGMSFYYLRYSTWKGKRLWLEDLIVTGKVSEVLH